MNRADKDRDEAILKAVDELEAARVDKDRTKEDAKACMDRYKTALKNVHQAKTADYENLYTQDAEQ